MSTQFTAQSLGQMKTSTHLRTKKSEIYSIGNFDIDVRCKTSTGVQEEVKSSQV